MARMINEYHGFGDWGENRGAGVLDAISKILGQSASIYEGHKGRQADKIQRKALANYASQIGADQLVPPDTKTENFSEPSYTAQGPRMKDNIDPSQYLPAINTSINRDSNVQRQDFPINTSLESRDRPIQVPMSKEKITRSSQDKFADMSPEQQMQLLAMMRTGGDEKGGKGPSINPVSLLSSIGSLNDFMKEIKSSDPLLYEALKKSAIAMGKANLPGFADAYNVKSIEDITGK